MSNYTESKKALDKIASKYNCKGDIIMRVAMQYIVEYGQHMLQDEEFINDQKQQIKDKHDAAEKDGKHLWISREFELTLIDCAIELAKINAYDLIIYIQKEMYFSNEGGIDYDRAIQSLKRCMDWIENDIDDTSITRDVFRNCIEFTDDEVEQLGWSYILEEEEDE